VFLAVFARGTALTCSGTAEVSFTPEMTNLGFEDYCRRKELAAASAALAGFTTLTEEAGGADLLSFGNEWTRGLFDGDFHRSAGPASPDLPSVSLILSEEADGVGTTVRHLLHEGLTRVDADAVLGGIGPASASDQICSVWHPELVRLRADRGLARHPAQVLVTDSGDVPFEECLLFHEPSLRVIVVTRGSVATKVRARLRAYPWVEVVGAGEPLDLRLALTQLRARGIAVISAVGGRRLATSLLDAGLVTDLYITMREPASAASALAFYHGPPLVRRRLLCKAGRGSEGAVRFEHLVPPSVYAPGLRLGLNYASRF
jgi:riboflavin biosynthesis pyrimidine reductase